MPPKVARLLPSLPPALKLFCAISILLTFFAVAVRLLVPSLTHPSVSTHSVSSLPRDSVLPTSDDAVDLTIFQTRFQHFHSPEFFSPSAGSPYTYPAAVAPLYWLFYRFHSPQGPFMIVGIALLLVLAMLLLRSLRRHGLGQDAALKLVAISIVCSYPFFFEFNRANMELFLWLFTATGVYLVLRDRPWSGATLLAVAAAMKLYPILFVAILVARRQYRQAAYLFAMTGILTLACLWLVCPDLRLASAGISAGMNGFLARYALEYQPIQIGVDHSLFAVIKRIGGDLPPPHYAHILPAYLGICAALGLAAYFLRIRHMPAINQVLCLTIACILLPPISFDYTLIHLYTPWAMLTILAIDRWRSGAPYVPGLLAVFLCMGILLSRLAEFFLHGERLGGQIKALVLLTLFLLALRFPFPSWIDHFAIPSLADSERSPEGA